MKAIIQVTLKKEVLDPQGQAIYQAARNLGYNAIKEIRQGKYFEIEILDGIDPQNVHTQINKLTNEILCNTTIEDFDINFEDSPKKLK